MGVVTGIVQEFQFGMNWSDYSRFVGDVFGAPLAFEALIAFFFESTFIGLWIFGWDKLPKRIHLACIWMVSIGTILSAYFILAANSWMQHPVGYRYQPEDQGRAELTDFWAVLTQNTALAQVFHTLTAAFLTGAAFMVGIAAYHLARKKHIPVMRTSLRLGLVTVVIAGAAHRDQRRHPRQGHVQAAADEDGRRRGAVGRPEAPRRSRSSPTATSTRATTRSRSRSPACCPSSPTTTSPRYVRGINDVNKAEQQKYGPGDYRPNIPVAYWGFRWMIGFGMVVLRRRRGRALADPQEVLARRSTCRTGDDEVPHLVLFRNKALGPTARHAGTGGIALWTLGFPLIANSWGWIFTEMGRQPWVVYGVLRTRDAVSPGVSQGEVLTSMIVFTVLYAVLAVVEVRLLAKYVKAGPPELTEADLNPPTRIGGDARDADRPMAFSY